MSDLCHEIMSHAVSAPEGTLLTGSGFSQLGRPAEIDQALLELTAAGELFQVEEGVWVCPVDGRFGRRPPSVGKVLAAYSAQRGEIITETCAASANIMQVSTQVPARPTYLTSGASRSIVLGSLNVELRQAPSWMIVLGNSRAGHAVRALVEAGASDMETTLRTLRRHLSDEDVAQFERVMPDAPKWVADALREMGNVPA